MSRDILEISDADRGHRTKAAGQAELARQKTA
jgi:hypothetical protein